MLQGSTYQIRIVEDKSDSQIALGTGFLVANDRLATNYHVVSNSVLEPEKFRIEIEVGGEVYLLKVLTVNVVHDLAVLQVKGLHNTQPYTLSLSDPVNGTVLYSLGDPHNLGLTIVEGNYNGVVENKFIERIHFSGAINSGMSGGPTVNKQLEVVGVNVATGGNQVGFLVPVKHLAFLLEKSLNLPENYNILDDMSEQISHSTERMIQELLAADWPSEPMGSAVVPGSKVPWLTCWGNSKDDKDKGILNISRGCNNGDNIYVNHHFTSGYLEYEYAYFEAKSWPSAAFYRYLKAATASAGAGNRANQEDVGNYECIDKIVKTKRIGARMTRRVSYCVRPYKLFKGLFDAFYIGLSQDRAHSALMDHFTISGISKASSLLFLEQFLEASGWE